jgi:hypothetical protein
MAEPIKFKQSPEYMEYIKFCKAVELMWSKSHLDIPVMSLGSPLFDNNKTIITFHLHRREPEDRTKKQRLVEAFSDEVQVTNLAGVTVVTDEHFVTARQDFINTVIFTVFTPIAKGGGEVADMICDEFERFMVEHTPALMLLGARNLTYGLRFHDDNLLKEYSQNSVRRFISYTLYTQIVTVSKLPILQKVVEETRLSLEALEKLNTSEVTSDDPEEF